MLPALLAASLISGPAADAVTPPVRFAALGDTGLGNADQRAVARSLKEVCAARGCDFVLLLGDNVYPRGMTSPDDPRIDEVITEMYREVDVPIFSVLGNHDWMSGPEGAAWQLDWAHHHDFVQMPGRYYAFQLGDAAFFALDTTLLARGEDPAQGDWLRAHLEASDARWKVVFGHHPFRSEGRHGNAGAYLGALSLLPGFTRGGPLREVLEQTVCAEADLYVSAHDHLLQWLRHCDTELLISGAGSEVRRAVGRGNETNFLVESLGFSWVELGEEMTVAFFNERGQKLHEGSRTAANPISERTDGARLP